MNVTQYCMQLDVWCEDNYTPPNQLVIAAWGVAASIEVCIWGSHTVSVVPLTKKEPLPLVGEEGLGVFSSLHSVPW